MAHHNHPPPRLSLAETLRQTLQRNAEYPVAITKSGHRFTATDLVGQAWALKNRVLNHPVVEDCWGVFTNSSINGLIAILGLFWAKKEPVLLPNIQRSILGDLEKHVGGFVTDSPNVVGQKNQLLLEPAQQFTERLHPDEPFVIPDTARLHLFTSGSSGQPEMIAKSLSNLESELHALEKAFSGLLKSAAVIATVSHQHIYGLLFHLLWPLATGRLIVDGLQHFPHEVSALFSNHPEACLISSPAFLNRAGPLVDFSANKNRKTVVFSSGGALPSATSQALRDTGRVTPIEVFGSTETGGIAYREQGSLLNNTPWTPLPGVQIRVEDELLEVRSPFLDSRTWWRTQDMVSLQIDHFVLKGRADRIAKIEEKRVHLGSLESFLMTSPLVDDVHALVAETPTPQLNALIVPSRNGWDTLAKMGRESFCADLRIYLSTGFEAATIPRRWYFVKRIPVNSQGKRHHQSLGKLLGEESALPNLPEVVSSFVDSGERSATMGFVVPSAIPALSGHFPDDPIVAGVVQIHWVDYFARQHLKLASTAKSMDRIKFKRVLTPGVHCRMNIQWDEIKKIVAFEITGDDAVFASGRLHYEVKQD